MPYKKEVGKTLWDALLYPFGVLWHGYKGNFGVVDENSMAIHDEKLFVQRVSPLRFLKDPAISYSEIQDASWIGRTIEMRLRDVLEEDAYFVDPKQIKGEVGFGSGFGSETPVTTKNGQVIGRNAMDITPIANFSGNLLEFTTEDFKRSSSSKFVKIHECYVRATKKEKKERGKNFMGWIVVYTPEQKEPLRVSEWVIKAEGWPAKLLEFIPVNDRMFGMPDIDTYSAIADQKNIITNLQIRNAQDNTKVWVGINKAEGDEEDIEKIRNGDNTIILFDGDTPARDRMFVATPGFVSSDLYQVTPLIQKNLEDKSGVTDLKRGFLQSGEESATSVKLRAAGGGARAAYRQDIMVDFLKSSMLYLNQLDKQFVTIKEAVRIIGSFDLQWSENPTKEELQADVDVEIDAISMAPENPEREMQEFQVALGMAIDAIRDPALSLKIKQEGKTVELTPLIEQILLRLKIRNPDVFRDIQMDESEGFVKVTELRAAQANIEAALQGNGDVPSPPAEGQDHRARIEMYSTILNTIKGLGDTITSQILSALVQIQGQMAEAEQNKQPRAGGKIATPDVKTVS